ncbi:L-seryl-tRNA(Sec) selenium transferase [Microvirga lotononidis]|uniref:L-seryl-tRNA(Sec) selenium transferase n=1 Tax=Microvirga lotononidis TaxID=864069 RepID=I4YXY5_9HYPH|nr:L-seryl-tRNA(Sec) selenium transferase [Microvirga lotononidis]EIM28827.1 seryl-tRNA(Sec) selenium transferase [Microvirga lotononidis]WQO25445.1 L-seryl-tRNA(Sec) selenium transferase [Microvirga lotononidis]
MVEAAPSLRQLPSVDRVLRQPDVATLIEKHGRVETTQAVRETLAALREEMRPGAVVDDTIITSAVLARLDARAKPRLRPLFNLTGTVLHTNLGRAILAEEAVKAATSAMREAVSLEFDLASGRRGERDDHVRALVCELTGAEDATLVNNNAAAVLLALNTFAHGREAIVSRGELIEIGGAFRMPEIMARAGARLCEVGTTNRTHPRDYADAMNPETGLILKVHTSNYRIEGFTAEVGARDLAKLARQHHVPFVNDLGSGTLVDLSRFGLRKEPTVRESVEEGADLVTFSGDKLLGGPQAGFIIGRKDLIAAINRNPMKRALRVDKMRLAACEATLRLYRDPDRLAQRLPTMRFLARSMEDIRQQALRLAPALAEIMGGSAVVEAAPCASQIGSGALPLDTIPSFGLVIRPKGSGQAVEALSAAFRRLPWPVIGRVAEGALVFDLRCLEDESLFQRNLASLRDEIAS